MEWVILLVKAILVVGALLGAGAYATLMERKVCARFQVRYGPNRAGPFGILQPVADGIKAFFKEELIPAHVDKLPYLIAPGVSFAAVLLVFSVVPFGPEIEILGRKVTLYIADPNAALLFALAVASLGSYGIVVGAWASNNKYSLLGGMRTVALMLSYELPMLLSLMSVALLVGSLRLTAIAEYQRSVPLLVWQPLGFLIFLIAVLAENNRSPFDLPETENELVSGFATEYGGIKFALFFIAEYTAMVVNSALLATIFLGGWRWPAPLSDIHPLVGLVLFAVKTAFFMFLYVWIRASLPRVRFDKFLRFSWQFLAPLALINLAATAVIVALGGVLL